mgnify:CR=1 FL=1
MNLSDNEYCLGRGVAGLRPKDGAIDGRYLWRTLEAFADKLRSRGRGTTFLQVSKADIAELEIPLPLLEEQRRIAAILDQADALRRLRARALDRLNTLGQSIFHEMFGNPVSNTMEWPSRTLGQTSIHVSDGNYAEKYPKSSDFVEEGVPFIRANNIVLGEVDGTDLRFISDEKHALLKKGHLKIDDVLITTRGKIGNTAIVPREFDGANINAQLVLLRCAGVSLSPIFLMFLLQHPSSQIYFEKVQTGVALKQLPVKRLKEMDIIEPPFELQNLFANRMRSILARISQVLR